MLWPIALAAFAPDAPPPRPPTPAETECRDQSGDYWTDAGRAFCTIDDVVYEADDRAPPRTRPPCRPQAQRCPAAPPLAGARR